MKKICGIYQIKYLGEDLRYIGQSVDIERRRKEHIRNLNGDRHRNTWMQNYWNKYGESAFEHSIIEEIPEEELNTREIYWIAYYGSKHTFNATPGGEGVGSGKESPSYNSTIYTFYHKDGRVEKCTQWELREKYGISDGSGISSLCSGKLKSTGGWALKHLTKEDYITIDQTIYTFYHKDGMVEKCKQWELREKYGIKDAGISAMLAGRKKSAHGWGLKRITKLDYDSTNSTIYTFYHKDGMVEKCTQWELKEKYGIPDASVSALCAGRNKTAHGWGLKRMTPADYASMDQTIYTFVHEDGREEKCTQWELKKKYGMRAASLSAVLTGRNKTAYGWSLKKKEG